MSYISKALPHPDRLCLNHSQPVTRMLNVEPGDTYERVRPMTQIKHAANDNAPTFLGRLKAWLEYSTAVSSLNRLDDRTLADIGLKRDQISDFVKSWSVKDDNAA